MKVLLSIIFTITLFGCAKTSVWNEEEVATSPTSLPTVMRLPNHSEILTGHIYFDSIDGHYKSASLDFGSTLTHPSSGYVTGQSGVGINSIAPKTGFGLISADIDGDRFTAYLPSFLSLPSYGPLYNVKSEWSWTAFEVDGIAMEMDYGSSWVSNFSAAGLYWWESENKYYALDSIKAKAKGVKIKSPVSTTEINGSIFSPNADGIVIFKGRILMNTDSPSGMSIYPYDYVAINETPQAPSGSGYPEFLPEYYQVDANTSLLFAVRFDPTHTYGTIVSYDYDGPSGYAIINSNFTGHISAFNSSGTSGSYYLTFYATLPDGRIVSCEEELVEW